MTDVVPCISVFVPSPSQAATLLCLFPACLGPRHKEGRTPCCRGAHEAVVSDVCIGIKSQRSGTEMVPAQSWLTVPLVVHLHQRHTTWRNLVFHSHQSSTDSNASTAVSNAVMYHERQHQHDQCEAHARVASSPESVSYSFVR